MHKIMAQLKTTQEINKELQIKFPFLELISEYTGANNKSTIKCNDCGHTWDAVPRSVISSKNGCPKCKQAKSRVNNSLKKFLDKYDSSKYELIEFRNYNDVTVKCKKCGYLRTTNSSNIYKYGCPKCGIEKTHDAQRLTKEEFIQKAKQIHGDKYNYDKVNYINYTTPVIITCPIHGDFAQMPGKHLAGHRCISCANKDMDTNKFIIRAKEVHGDYYNYSKVNYKTMTDRVCIICPKHGEFWQTPEIHINMKCGCPICSKSHGERETYRILKELNIKFEDQFKINNPYNNTKFIVDFYLPKYNAIIEYNGQQHYMPVEKFGGKLQFEKQIIRDNHLRQYCKENNIRLLEIKYDVNNIEEIIQDFLALPCN